MTLQHGRHRQTLTIVSFILLVLVFTTMVHADYNIKVTDNTAQVNINGDLLQAVPNVSANNTAESFDSIPVFAFHFAGDNSSLLSNHLDVALRQLSPSASGKDVTFDSSSNGTNYHYKLSFTVGGVFAKQGDLNTVDLSWRSFVIGDDFKQNNMSLNAVVPSYLQKGVALYAALPASSGPPNVVTRQWYWNKRILQRGNVVPTIQNLLMLNYSSLAKPLQSWDANPTNPGHAVRYQTTTGFNLTQIETFKEPEGNTNIAKDIIYTITATVDLPWNSIVSSDNVMIESVTALSTFLMIILVISTVATFAVTVFLQRHFKPSQREQRTRRLKG